MRRYVSVLNTRETILMQSGISSMCVISNNLTALPRLPSNQERESASVMPAAHSTKNCSVSPRTVSTSWRKQSILWTRWNSNFPTIDNYPHTLPISRPILPGKMSISSILMQRCSRTTRLHGNTKQTCLSIMHKQNNAPLSLNPTQPSTTSSGQWIPMKKSPTSAYMQDLCSKQQEDSLS